jgi:3',5'-cyclic AMP phosphodiesterase CpdA
VQTVLAVLLPALLTACRLTPAGQTDQQAFTFVQLCDPQLGMGGYEHDLASFRQAVERINQLEPDFVLICGDLVHDRTEQAFADFKAIRADLAVPSYCVPGNHDVGGEPTLETLQHYRRIIGDDIYSFEHKGVTFVCVNTQLWKTPVDGETDRQDAWLEETLSRASERKSPVVIAGHHPLFLKQPDEPGEYMNLPVESRMRLLRLYEDREVAAVLGGHTHRLIIHDFKGIQLVNGETTSKNFDGRPLGFRLWHVDRTGLLQHEFITLDAAASGE